MSSTVSPSSFSSSSGSSRSSSPSSRESQSPRKLCEMSYVEFKYGNIYISRFKSSAPACTSIPTVDGPLFPQLSDVSDLDAVRWMRSLLDSMRRKDFGLHDVFWFLPEALKGNTTCAAIIEWMRSLYIASCELKKSDWEVTIKSRSDSAFQLIAFAHDISLPGEALDTPALFVGKDGKIMAVIGRKAKAPTAKVNFDIGDRHGFIDVLKVGLHGDVIVGEHIDPAEKPGLFAALAEFNASGAPFLELKAKTAGAAMRAMAEETGIVLDGEGSARYFIIGEDAEDGRDPRYWKCGSLYGYRRKSRSVMIVVVLQCEMPAELPDPQDLIECEKARVFPLDFVLPEFRRDGQLKPAFDAHVRQLKAVADVLPAILATLRAES